MVGQRQTVVSQFYQLDRLVVEGGAALEEKGGNRIMRQKDVGLVVSPSYLSYDTVGGLTADGLV